MKLVSSIHSGARRVGPIQPISVICFMLLIGQMVFFGCQRENKNSSNITQTCEEIIEVKKLPAELALKWYELELKFIRRKPAFTPPVAARTIGYTGIILYESLVYGMPEYRSLSSTLNIPDLPSPDGVEYLWTISANAALAVTLKRFTGLLSASDSLEIEMLEEYYNQKFTKVTSKKQYLESAKFGRAVAEAIYKWSLKDGGHDGFQNNYGKYMPAPSLPGMWQSTAFTGGLLPFWGKNRHLLPTNARICQPPPPPIYSDEKNSILFKEANEVYTVFQHLTDEQADIAKFWADPPGSTFTPAGHSIQLLCQVIKEKELALDSAAIAFAKLGIALNDAFISCWETKYSYNYLRPITYIRKHIKEDWIPFLPTPNFPEYSSGHSVQSAAMAEVMTSLFGNEYSFTDYTNDTLGYEPRHFTSFWSCANEAAMSRLYGGIHFPISISNGLIQGQKIGQNVSQLNLKKDEKAVVEANLHPVTNRSIDRNGQM